MNDIWFDKTTGLTWELKTSENVGNAFTWDESFKYAEKLNKENFGGFNDWRIPTIYELKTIIAAELNNGKLIKKELAENCAYGYWSSTTYEYYKYRAWYVYFSNGYVGNGDKLYNGYVRCVRAGK